MFDFLEMIGMIILCIFVAALLLVVGPAIIITAFRILNYIVVGG